MSQQACPELDEIDEDCKETAADIVEQALLAYSHDDDRGIQMKKIHSNPSSMYLGNQKNTSKASIGTENMRLTSHFYKSAKKGSIQESLFDINGQLIKVSSVDEEDTVSIAPIHCIHSLWRKHHLIKVISITTLCVIACAVFMALPKQELHRSRIFSIDKKSPYTFKITKKINSGYMGMMLEGPFQSESFNTTTPQMDVFIYKTPKNSNLSNTSKVVINKKFHLLPDFPTTNEIVYYHFDLAMITVESKMDYFISFEAPELVSMKLNLNDAGAYGRYEVISAAVVLMFLYVMIVFEIVHRTIAAMISAICSIAVLTVFGMGPTLEEVVEWVDWETIFLLFGMMTLVAIFAETGFFDYSAVLAYKISHGHTWYLIIILCLFSAFVSAFLDNVTTMLLMTPVTIKIGEALHIESKWLLIAEVIMSNIGGTATAIGDPPNVLIISNRTVKSHGINFFEFTKNMFFGAIIAGVVGLLTIRILYMGKSLNHDDEPEIRRTKTAIHMWKKYARKLPSLSREENEMKAMIMQHVHTMEKVLKEKISHAKHNTNPVQWKAELKDLEKAYVIKDYVLLTKTGIVLFAVIALFFIESTQIIHTQLGWIATLGAVVLLIVSDIEDLDHVLHKIEWATLLFFASLFVLMKALEKLHLIEFIGDQTAHFISELDADIRFPAALIIVLWVSALASSFIDNIPFTTAMIPVVIKLAELENIYEKPLFWALAYGACLGGNGTLIGASANLVCAGVAEQKGCKITFLDFFKVGFPTMIISVASMTLFLLARHVYPFQFNE